MTVTINGTTGIDAVQSGTVQQADLAANVAGNGPAFIANQGAGQTVTSGVPVAPNYTNIQFETNVGWYSTATRRFTPQVAGLYQVSLSTSASATTATNRLIVAIQKNGVTFAASAAPPLGSPNTMWQAVSGLVSLNGTTDYIEPNVQFEGTGTLTVNGASNSFSAVLVRAA